MKLGNFFTGNVLTLSQSPHGSNQNGKAIDCVPTSGTRVIAPCDMEIYYRKNDLGHQSYSYARGDGWKMVFVHCIIEKLGHVKKGTDIGYLHTGGAVHLHVAIEVNGVWDVVLNYMDRSINLALTSGFQSQHWKNWSTWADKQLGGTSSPDWCVGRDIRDRSASQMDLYLNTYRRDVKNAGVDPVLWWVKHGSMEVTQQVFDLDGLYKSMTADRDKYAKMVATKDAEIAKLNASIGGLTTDRNKYATMVQEVQSKLDGANEEVKRLTLEVDIMGEDNRHLNHKLLEEQQANITCQESLEPLKKESAEKDGRIKTLNTELEKVIKAYTQLVKDNKKPEVNWGSYIPRLIRAIRSFIARNARDNS